MFPKPSPVLEEIIRRNIAEGKALHDAQVENSMKGFWYLKYFKHLGGSDENNDECHVKLLATTQEEAEKEAVEKWGRIKSQNPRIMHEPPKAYRPTLFFKKYLESPEHPTEVHYK